MARFVLMGAEKKSWISLLCFLAFVLCSPAHHLIIHEEILTWHWFFSFHSGWAKFFILLEIECIKDINLVWPSVNSTVANALLTRRPHWYKNWLNNEPPAYLCWHLSITVLYTLRSLLRAPACLTIFTNWRPFLTFQGAFFRKFCPFSNFSLS